MKKKLFFIIPTSLLVCVLALFVFIFCGIKHDTTEQEHQDFVAYKNNLLAANNIAETDDGVYYVPFFTDADGTEWKYNRGRYLILNENFLTSKDDGYSFNSAGTFDILAANPLSGVGTGSVSMSGTTPTEATINASTKIAENIEISKCIVDLSEFMQTNTYSTLIFKAGSTSVTITWNGYTAGDNCQEVKIGNSKNLSALGENQHVSVLIYAGPILSNFTKLSVILLNSDGRVIGYNIDDNGEIVAGQVESSDSNQVTTTCILALGYKNTDVSTVVVYSETAASKKWGKIEKPADDKITTSDDYTIRWKLN